MHQPEKIWIPSPSFRERSHLSRYSSWLKENYSLNFRDYDSLWQWSTSHPADFWESIWKYFNIKSYTPYREVMSSEPMPHTRWFDGSTLNYAEHIFRNKTKERPALLYRSETTLLKEVSWEELESQTGALQAFFRKAKLCPGERVAACLPNIPEASVGLLATLSVGAIWSSCSPDFGAEGIIDRFSQISPKILIMASGYTYNGRPFNRLDVLEKVRKSLPTVDKVILVPFPGREDSARPEGVTLWEEAMQMQHGPLEFTPVPFAHPIWILYSSGTTGTPKAITHSHGGMLLEHLKYLSFHNDVHPGENFFWYSTTGWMMWNFVHASLLTGATAVLYEGSPAYPGLEALWELADKAPIHHFGASAPFLVACMKAGLNIREKYPLMSLRSIGSTGSPLPPEAFRYVYEQIREDVWLCSMSGGTDVCTAWVGGCPWEPVYDGEIQRRCLGVSMEAYDEKGFPLENEVGEMVVTVPLPCMPVYFWNDPRHERYLESYFSTYPGVWRHGDWLQITPHKGVRLLGRSDATLNRQGVRIGTAEIYRAMDKVEEVRESLIVNLERPGNGDYMPLFVLLKEGVSLTDELRERIKRIIREEFSPRHVPDAIIAVPDIPFTISGKKMETPVKKILMGKPSAEAANRAAMRNPGSLDFYSDLAKKLC
ncbi:acetoacetyl-CoA synthetase [Anseongella ginsenosidimutans]|uniref:Acetoacetyl-CoA synthetase n=1 Tax=Anseongella ginsenosidimutans TaxID=496056 RepID=A0A4V2UTU3_9SPHI|nr:acetoacetate--CoA ligase [Anseongella ginsenosidimutans]QEC53110.1 acetoacetate--CoA ligase [Anseongella ginsenosidimutans]TCS87728.1 acetoacetyl-CoA synthetase [Anseongella ginsenosidimutans]